jgi:2-dehydro-3-deoxyphosphogluconate aldolase/(4S)-4-hydroxy-2-oxoglutarate aldolase
MNDHAIRSNESLDGRFAGHSIMVILRNMQPQDAVAFATVAWDLGITLVEVPIQTPEFVPSLAAVVAAGRERGINVGAGTIVDAAQVDVIDELGVAFAVAPGWDRNVAMMCLERDIPFLPGVATATEVQSVRAAGLEWMKAFPASLLGPKWLPAMHGPFPQAKFVVTGGVGIGNAESFLDAGARVVALGSALESPAMLGALRDKTAAR